MAAVAYRIVYDGVSLGKCLLACAIIDDNSAVYSLVIASSYICKAWAPRQVPNIEPDIFATYCKKSLFKVDAYGRIELFLVLGVHEAIEYAAFA